MDIQIARVTHFYDKVHVAVIEIISQPLSVGDTIRIRGAITDFVQVVTMLQVENNQVTIVEAGETCALRVESPVEIGDMIYLQSKKQHI